MAAIITENFRRLSTQLFLNDLKGRDYYVGIGKSDPWVGEGSPSFNVPLPTGTASEQQEVLSNLSTLIQVQDENTGLVIPNIKYKVNSYYKEYDPTDDSCFFPAVADNGVTINPCYMTTSGGYIFLCIKSGPGLSTELPPESITYTPNRMPDGYIWALVDKIDFNNSSVVNTNQFISINAGSLTGANQTVSAQATGNLLYGFTILNGGSGYNPAIQQIPFIWHTSDAQEPMQCPITVDVNGIITSISLPVDYDYDGRILGGYFDFDNFAGVGSGAVIVPRIAPVNGFAYTPREILPAWYVSISISAADDINRDGLYTPYRQISLVKEPLAVNQAGDVSTLGTLRYAEAANDISDLNLLRTGDIIEFTNGTRAFYDTYDLVDGKYRLYFHQNDNTGYGSIPFTAGSFTNISGNGTVYTYLEIKGNEYTTSTGTVVFIENRKAISRAENQTEQIKIIIQL
jgi:hypothetical protein